MACFNNASISQSYFCIVELSTVGWTSDLWSGMHFALPFTRILPPARLFYLCRRNFPIAELSFMVFWTCRWCETWGSNGAYTCSNCSKRCFIKLSEVEIDRKGCGITICNRGECWRGYTGVLPRSGVTGDVLWSVMKVRLNDFVCAPTFELILYINRMNKLT